MTSNNDLCLSFNHWPTGLLSNPYPDQGLTLTSFDYQGNQKTNNRTLGSASGTLFDCGHMLIIEIIEALSTGQVTLDLLAQANLGQVEAFDGNGQLQDNRTMSAKREVIKLRGNNIRKVIVKARNDELGLVRFCYTLE